MSANRREFLKQIGIGAIGLGFISTLPNDLQAKAKNNFGLPRSTPEQQGISSVGIEAFLDAVEKSKIEFHSLMIVRHGHVVAEGWWAPYAAELKHTLYSLSKSFTSTAVGFAIAEGRFTLETPVFSFFPNDKPNEITPNLAAMQVKHLLSMSTGHAKDTMPGLRSATNETWVKTFLSLPVDLEPGTFFLYNTGATYMLSAIVQKTSGQSLMQYLQSRLFDPLGMEGMDWETSPEGINTGGYGLRVKTEDIAKFGQLYLQKGKWNGKQIMAADWIANATTSHINSNPAVPKRPKEEDDWSQGYGYQFWRCRHNAYRGDGAFGQYCIVIPEQDAVVAITSESFDMQASMNLVWTHLLPAMKEGALPGNIQSNKSIQAKLKNLSLPPLAMNLNSPVAPQISGKEFALESNNFAVTKVAFRFSNGGCQFLFTDSKGEHLVKLGMNKWMKGDEVSSKLLFPMTGRPEVSTPLVASATWSDDHTLMMTVRYPATAHSDTISCKFEDNKVTLKFLNSVSKGNPTSLEQRPDLHGQMNG